MTDDATDPSTLTSGHPPAYMPVSVQKSGPRTAPAVLVAVGGPVPGLAGQVVEAEAGGVAVEPLPGRVAVAVDERAVVGEVDGEALLVHRLAGPGRRRVALRRGLLVHVVVARAAVG